ncbi:MAG: hypothetical protein M3360_00580 [Actinomycetota bacterium]|nr:hypothetical protein [Actinomycetota bacterium]
MTERLPDHVMTESLQGPAVTGPFPNPAVTGPFPYPAVTELSGAMRGRVPPRAWRGRTEGAEEGTF